jgi:hypothetical protein
MFNPDDLAADTLEAMADTVLTDAEWAEAFGWDAEEDTTTEAAYWQQVDAANDYADYLEARAMADLDEDDDDQGYDPTPDGEPAPPAGPAAARSRGWWYAEFSNQRESAMAQLEHGSWRAVVELDRRLALLADVPAGTALRQCPDCETGWGSTLYHDYRCCETCNGVGLVPAPAVLPMIARQSSVTEPTHHDDDHWTPQAA